MKRTSFGRCEQSTPNAAICLQMAPHPPLTTRVLCHGAAFRLEGHTNPPPLFTLTVQFNYLGPPSLWRELSELSASLSLALSFFFFDWSILARNPFSYDHMSQCLHYSWRAISAGRLHHPAWKEKTKREARNPFSECWLCCMVLYAPQSLQIWVSVPHDVSLRLPTAPSFSFSLLFYAFFCCDCDTLFSSSSFIFATTAKRRQSRID